MESVEFAAALRVLTAAQDSDWTPTSAEEAGRLRAVLLPELQRLHTHHADQLATVDEAIATAEQLSEADSGDDRSDVHAQLVDVVAQIVAGYRELGIGEETGNPERGLDSGLRIGIP